MWCSLSETRVGGVLLSLSCTYAGAQSLRKDTWRKHGGLEVDSEFPGSVVRRAGQDVNLRPE